MSGRTLTQAELVAEAKGRFGDNPLDFAFQCPNCGDVATIRDFNALDIAGVAARAGQECIGRSLGALDISKPKYDGRGCNWAAYGLFSGPWFVTMPDGREVASFPLADAPAEVTP